MLTLYGIKSCDSCRAARKWLDANNIEYEVHDLRDAGLSMQTIKRWSQHLDWAKLLNKRSLTWRKIPDADREDLDRDRAIALMVDNPTLVKRPVLELGSFVAVGFSPEGYAKALARAKKRS